MDTVESAIAISRSSTEVKKKLKRNLKRSMNLNEVGISDRQEKCQDFLASLLTHEKREE